MYQLPTMKVIARYCKQVLIKINITLKKILNFSPFVDFNCFLTCFDIESFTHCSSLWLSSHELSRPLLNGDFKCQDPKNYHQLWFLESTVKQSTVEETALNVQLLKSNPKTQKLFSTSLLYRVRVSILADSYRHMWHFYHSHPCYLPCSSFSASFTFLCDFRCILSILSISISPITHP